MEVKREERKLVIFNDTPMDNRINGNALDEIFSLMGLSSKISKLRSSAVSPSPPKQVRD